MGCSMPKKHGNEIVVSDDEEAYLRAAFRRFAIPYMLGALAIFAIVALWAIARTAEPQVNIKPVIAQPMLDELKAESLALRAQLSRVLERVNAVGEEISGAGRRVDELERRVESFTGRGGIGPKELAAFTKRLDESNRRIQELESSRAKLEARAARALTPPAETPKPPAAPFAEPARPTQPTTPPPL